MKEKGTPLKIAILVLYDHRKCRIDRYLLNIGEPFDVEFIRLNESKFQDDKKLLPKEENYVFEDDFNYNTQKIIKYFFTENRMSNGKPILKIPCNGKLSKQFFFEFLYDILYRFINNTDYSYSKMYDNRLINAILNRHDDIYLDFEFKKSKLDEQLFPIDRNKKIIINIPKGIHSLFDKKVNSILDNNLGGGILNFKLEPYLLKDSPQVIRDIRSSLDLKSIDSNLKLDAKISQFNKLNKKRYDLMLSNYKK